MSRRTRLSTAAVFGGGDGGETRTAGVVVGQLQIELARYDGAGRCVAKSDTVQSLIDVAQIRLHDHSIESVVRQLGQMGVFG